MSFIYEHVCVNVGGVDPVTGKVLGQSAAGLYYLGLKAKAISIANTDSLPTYLGPTSSEIIIPKRSLKLISVAEN